MQPLRSSVNERATKKAVLQIARKLGRESQWFYPNACARMGTVKFSSIAIIGVRVPQGFVDWVTSGGFWNYLRQVVS